MALPLSVLGQFFGWFALSFPLPAALLLAAARGTRWRVVRAGEAALSRLARRPAVAVMITGGLGFLVSLALCLFVRWPQPHVHDEFSYLLAADTFLHGRLSNPTHPLWPHFESLHTIQQPSYASKYPPGQGLILAAGQLVTGQAAAGLWLSAGLACAALCWMLQAWLPARWAALGGLLAAVHPTIIKWSQCYWGGLVAVIGGALLLGGLRRLCVRPGETPRARDAALMALGIAVLANSRPYEGAALTVASLAVLAAHRATRPFLWKRVGLPLGAVLTLTAVWMGYYNFRVTGNATLMPYVVHERTYEPVSFLMFLPPHPVPFLRHKSMRDISVDGALYDYVREHSPAGVLQETSQKLGILARGGLQLFDLSVDGFDPPSQGGVLKTALHNVLLIPLLALPWALRRCRGTRTALGLGAAILGTLLLETWMHPHYAAPAAGLLAVLLLQGLRRLRAWHWRGHRLGLSLGRMVVGLYLLSFVSTVGELRQPEWQWPGWPPAKQQIITQLSQGRTPHDLVIVRYAPDHRASDGEWVYNGADIDGSPVVWARELTPSENARLLSYFPNRRAWLLEPDRRPLRLSPYPTLPQAADTRRY